MLKFAKYSVYGLLSITLLAAITVARVDPSKPEKYVDCRPPVPGEKLIVTYDRRDGKTFCEYHDVIAYGMAR